MALRLQLAGATNIGRVRRENQDRFLIRAAPQLAAVADGLGGLAGGAAAAQLAIDRLAAIADTGLPRHSAAWRELFDTLTRQVYDLGLRLNPGIGIGTTLTVAAAQDRRLVLAHVGDSAAFRLRAGNLEQLTEEHTLAAEARMRQAAGSTEAIPRAAEHTITSCLGLPYLPRIDLRETDLAPGDRLLLCSDGLTKPVAAGAIRAALTAATTAEDAAAALLALADQAGAPDNITAVVGFALED